ncbi:MAG: ABC transporter ATP-binding protein [Clostridiales bacterium]|nr:ABC transporter ATP-binding protein [Clostridiales bacterium]
MMGKLLKVIKKCRNQGSYLVWLVSYSLPYIPKIALVMALGIVDTLLSVGLAIILKRIIDGAASGGINGEVILIYLGGVLLSMLIGAISQLISTVLNEKFSFGIRKQIYDKIVRSYWMDVKQYHTGDLLTRMTSDTEIVSEGIVVLIPTIVRLFIELIITFFTLFYFEPSLAVFALVLAPISCLICFILGKKLKKLQIKVQESESKYRSFIQESLSNLLIVKAFANENNSVERLGELRQERFNWVFKKSKMSLVSSAVLSLSFQLGYIGAFTIGAFLLAKKAITFGTMSVFMTLVNRIQAPILALAHTIPRIISVLASAGRVIELQDMPLEISDRTYIDTTHVGVKVEKLCFGYSDDIVLDNISFTVKPGEFVAVVGASGIGKTTLIRLIMSFIHSAAGSIQFINNKGESENVNAGVREFISYVPQGNTLFSGTVRDNIQMGKLTATEDEIQEALNLSASAHFVQQLPHGLDTVIGEKGHGLSEGQAQRIAIARALIRKSPLLILDEATSALDEPTELKVIEGIRSQKPRITCLIISHRKSVLGYCDRELQIDNKKISENIA